MEKGVDPRLGHLYILIRCPCTHPDSADDLVLDQNGEPTAYDTEPSLIACEDPEGGPSRLGEFSVFVGRRPGRRGGIGLADGDVDAGDLSPSIR